MRGLVNMIKPFFYASMLYSMYKGEKKDEKGEKKVKKGGKKVKKRVKKGLKR